MNRPYYEQDGITIYHGDCREILPTVSVGRVVIVTSPPYGVGKSYESEQSDLDFEFLIRSSLAACASVMDGGDYIAMNLPDRLTLDLVSGMRPTLPMLWRDVASLDLAYYDRRMWVKDPCWATCQWHGASPKAVQEVEDIHIFRKKGLSGDERQIIAGISQAIAASGISRRQLADQLGVTTGMVEHWSSVYGQPCVPSRDRFTQLCEALNLSQCLIDAFDRCDALDRKRLTDQEWGAWGSRQVWTIPSIRKFQDHPAEFPIVIPSRCIRLFGGDNQTVVDPFMGIGTTLAAAKRLQRNAIGIEINERYCEIAATRLAQRALPLELSCV